MRARSVLGLFATLSVLLPACGGGGGSSGPSGSGSVGALPGASVFVVAGLPTARNIYVATLAGEVRRLNEAPYPDFETPRSRDAVWSADGAYVAHLERAAGTDRDDVIATRLADGRRTTLSSTVADAFRAVNLEWSPSGARLLFHTRSSAPAPDDRREIVLAEPQTGERRIVSAWFGDASVTTAWQPGGSALAVTSRFAVVGTIYHQSSVHNGQGDFVASLAPASPATETISPFFSERNRGWSPGEHLHAIQAEDGGQEDLYTAVPGLAPEPIVVLPAGRRFENAAWAPDGHRIAYVADALGFEEFSGFVIGALGGPSVPVAAGAVDDPVLFVWWSPDGAYVHAGRTSAGRRRPPRLERRREPRLCSATVRAVRQDPVDHRAVRDPRDQRTFAFDRHTR